MPERWRPKVHLGGQGKISIGASILNSCCLAQSDRNHFVWNHSLLSGEYPHLIKPAELQSAAQCLFYLPFQSLRALLWITSNVCSSGKFLFSLLFPDDILFPSAQLVNRTSNLPRKTGNSNDAMWGGTRMHWLHSAHLLSWQQNSCSPNGKSDTLNLCFHPRSAHLLGTFRLLSCQMMNSKGHWDGFLIQLYCFAVSYVRSCSVLSWNILNTNCKEWLTAQQ